MLGSGRSLEKGMATHRSILAWKIPWTEEPVGGGGGAATGKQSDTTEQLTLYEGWEWVQVQRRLGSSLNEFSQTGEN